MTSHNEKRQIFPGLWVPSLYIAEGLPFVGVVTVSVLMYKSMGLKDADIAFFTTVVTLPWSLKPLWSPFLEMFKTKKFFVLATQLLGGVLFGFLVLSLAPLLGADLPVDRSAINLSLVAFGLIAFNAATHDIVADGVYINSLTTKQQAEFSGWQGAAYNVGKVIAQGGLVALAGQLEQTVGVVEAWMIVMGLFGGVMVLIGLYHIKVLPTGGESTPPKNIGEAYSTFFDILRTFLRKKHVLWGMLFVVLFRFSEGQQVKIVPLFFRADRAAGGLGLTTSDMGLVYGTFGAGAFIVGSLLGGYFVASRGLKKSLLILCLLFNVPNTVYATLAFTTPESYPAICAAIVFEWFGYGFGFVGITLFMMQQIAPGRFKMAHYAFATALMNIGFMAPSAISGYVSDWLGYRNFFVWVVVATIPSFWVAWKVPFKKEEQFDAEEAEAADSNTYERAPATGAWAMVIATVSLFVGLGISIAESEGSQLFYAVSLGGLILSIAWFRSPYVALRGDNLRLALSPFSKKLLKRSDVAESAYADGIWRLTLTSGQVVQMSCAKVRGQDAERFEAFAGGFQSVA